MLSRAATAVQVLPGVEGPHLAPGVHPGVGAPGAGQVHGVAEVAFAGPGQHPGDGALAGLGGEAPEAAAVVGHDHAHPHGAAGGDGGGGVRAGLVGEEGHARVGGRGRPRPWRLVPWPGTIARLR